MAARLDRIEVVMAASRAVRSRGVAAGTSIEYVSIDEEEFSVKPIRLRRRAWEDMHRPSHITVTIVPGDELNEGGEEE